MAAHGTLVTHGARGPMGAMGPMGIMTPVGLGPAIMFLQLKVELETHWPVGFQLLLQTRRNQDVPPQAPIKTSYIWASF